MQRLSEKLQKVRSEVERTLIGHHELVRNLMAAVVAGGHVLLEDVPGTGKTTLATSFAKALGLSFARIQGTPDLLPGDLVGSLLLDPRNNQFSFRQGPVFTQLLLMDEINRATPRTQSALLEAMAEGHVTVDGETHPLPQPFVVFATANPVESQGVFPLPEAQLDRFLVQLTLGYVDEESEREMVRKIRLESPVELVQQMVPEELQRTMKMTRSVTVVDDVLRYAVALGRFTRDQQQVVLGASPRAILALIAFAQGIAFVNGRTFVTPDDVRAAWLPVMRHRIKTHLSYDLDSSDALEILQAPLHAVPVPTELANEV